jgi:A/G-specific adenine glycosylase
VASVPRKTTTGKTPAVADGGFSRRLLRWYDRGHRDLPWRGKPSPYAVLVSELMLQQTQVVTVIPYFKAFMQKFPTLKALATAPEESVMHAWAGLGYYSRARNLQAAGRVSLERHEGKLPGTLVELRALPGVGEYTASAVGAIAFGIKTFALDGNAIRVISRVFAEKGEVGKASVRERLRVLGEGLVPAARPGDFAQAVMELGATICTPRAPACPSCPIRGECAAFAGGFVESLPLKSKRTAKRLMYGVAVVAREGDKIWMFQKTTGRLLKGLWTVPLLETPLALATSAQALVIAAKLMAENRITIDNPSVFDGTVRHVFTHIDARVVVVGGQVRPVRGGVRNPAGWSLCDPGERPLSTFVKKLIVQGRH